jgi:acyl carrier protein
MNAVTSTNQIEQDLQGYISREVVRRGKNVPVEAALVESGLLDSLGLLQIVAYIERQYGVNLTTSGGPDDFRSISSLAVAIGRLGP